jgi:tight adherence protein B
MTSQSLMPIVLLLLICAAAIALWFDARQRRLSRQVANIVRETQAADLRSIRRQESGSHGQWLARLVNYRAEVGYVVRPVYVLLAGVVTAAAVFYANRTFGFSALSVSIAAALAAIAVIRGVFGWQQRRFADRLFRQLPDTIQLVTSTVRSGLPVNEAFRTIARDMPEPTAGQFAIVCSEMNLGRPPAEAIEAVYERTQVAEYAIFSVTLAVQLKSGGTLSETLQTLADTVTQRVALAARAKALAGEVIFSSRALSVAPLIVGGLLYLMSPESIEVLFTDPTGKKLLAYAIASVVVGFFVIRWMVRKETAL